MQTHSRRRPRILPFQRPAALDPTDPYAVSDFAVSQVLEALKRGRKPRPYALIHVAILNALDELRGVPRIVKGPWRLTTEHMRRWLLIHEPRFVGAYPEFFDETREFNEAAFAAALRAALDATRRAQQQAGAR